MYNVFLRQDHNVRIQSVQWPFPSTTLTMGQGCLLEQGHLIADVTLLVTLGRCPCPEHSSLSKPHR